MKYGILGLIIFLVTIPLIFGETVEFPQGNVTIEIPYYNVSFNYTLDENKNLTVLDLNTSKECDIVAYFDNKPLFFYKVLNNSNSKTYNIILLNGTTAIVGVNASNCNTLELTENCTFVGWNKTLGYAFFLFDSIGEEKSGIIKLNMQKPESSSSITSTTSTSYYYSGSVGGVGGISNIASNIKSPIIREFVKISKLIVGSKIDANLSARDLKDSYELTNQPLEITDDAILIGGPVANPLTKEYMYKFPVKVTNDYPGKHKGVIEKITLKVRVDNNIYRDVTVVLLAGSDRWGTKAAVEYFKQLDDIPDEPIFVEWKNGKAIKIEKP